MVNVMSAESAPANRATAPPLLFRIVSPIKRSIAVLLVNVLNECVAPDAGMVVMPTADEPSLSVTVDEFVKPALVSTIVAPVVIGLKPENPGVIVYEVA